jgi:hypothetical protein
MAYSIYIIFEISIIGIGYSILVSSVVHFLLIFFHSIVKFRIEPYALFINTPFIVLPSVIMILTLIYFNQFIIFTGFSLLIIKIIIGILSFLASIVVLFSIFRKEHILNLLKERG